jgi:predicted small secreted protein
MVDPHSSARAGGLGRPARILPLSLILAAILLAGCKGATLSGAAGNQVDRMGGPGSQRGDGMNRDGGGY